VIFVAADIRCGAPDQQLLEIAGCEGIIMVVDGGVLAKRHLFWSGFGSDLMLGVFKLLGQVRCGGRDSVPDAVINVGGSLLRLTVAVPRAMQNIALRKMVIVN
jgi:hypothetical protein